MAVIKVSERAGDYADQTTATEHLALISRTKAGKRRRFDLAMVCFVGKKIWSDARLAASYRPVEKPFLTPHMLPSGLLRYMLSIDGRARV